MKAEFHKIFKLFEELEEAGESATLTISSKGGISSIKLLLESSPSSPSTGTTPTTLPPAPGRRRRQLQGPAAGSGQLTTRPPSWRCQHLLPLLLQEKPVFQLVPHSAALSSSFPLHHTPLGVAGSCLWGGRLYHPLAASTLMAHPLHHHHRPRPLLLHPHLLLAQQLRKSNKLLINFVSCLKCLKTQPVKTHWYGKLAAKILQILD